MRRAGTPSEEIFRFLYESGGSFPDAIKLLMEFEKLSLSEAMRFAMINNIWPDERYSQNPNWDALW